VGVAEELCSSVAAARLVAAVRGAVADACTLPHDAPRLQPLLKVSVASEARCKICDWVRSYPLKLLRCPLKV
jgi:hypothetical protein